jgi:hypothetical protein
VAEVELDAIITYFPIQHHKSSKLNSYTTHISYCTKQTVASSLSWASGLLFETMAAKGEVYQLAFPPNPKPYISTGLPFPAACAHHITNTYHASRVYVIVSSSISKTDNFARLHHGLGDKIVGVRRGIRPHTPWDDILEIVKDIKEKEADIIVTLGAGSLTDGAKVVVFVSLPSSHENAQSVVVTFHRPWQMMFLS